MKGKYKVLRDNIKNVVAQEFEKTIPIITEEYEAKIRRQAEEITRLLAENEKLKKDLEYYHTGTDICDMESARIAGQNEAWELARKIVLYDKDSYSGEELKEIFGYAYSQTLMKNYTYLEAAAKVAEWENEKEEIKDGDVLEGIYDNEVKCIVTNLCPDNMAYLVFDDGTAGVYELDNLKKTGRHIDIDSFLKQIGGNGNER